LDKDRANNFRDVVEDQFNLEFFDLRLEFSSFQRFSELSFKDGKYSFDLVSLMIRGLVERSGEFSTIDAEYPFSFSVSDRDKRISVQIISNQSVNIFRIISFIEDIGFRFSRSVTLNKEFFRMRDIMDRTLRDLEPGDDLSISIDGDRGFQESFSSFSGSPGII